MDFSNIKDASIYVGTYAKYNDGSLFGKWMKLSDYADKDEFYKACAELHKDEADPEFMFQDWEYIPDGLIGESWVSPLVWGLMEQDDDDLDIACHYLSACSVKLEDYEDADDLVREARDKFIGQYDSLYDFGYEMAEMGCIEIPDSCKNYFDYEAFGRDCAYDYYEDDGYYFDTNR